jgi:hypothetical protein
MKMYGSSLGSNPAFSHLTRHNLTYNCWKRLQPGSSRLQPVAGAKNAYITRLQPAPASENAYITRLQQLAGAGLEPAGASGWSRVVYTLDCRRLLASSDRLSPREAKRPRPVGREF